MGTFWRWLKTPRLSIADVLLFVSLMMFAIALKLSSGLPWPVVIAAVGTFTFLAAVLAGFLKGLIRLVRR